jgi:predicted nucleotidyltransferase
MRQFGERRPLFVLEEKLGCAWENLRKADSAATAAQKALQETLEKGMGKFASEDSNLVVFGSLARREWIDAESDLDWTYFVDGQAISRHLKIAQEIKSVLKKATRLTEGQPVPRFGAPGQTGTFGNLAFSHQLVHLIGGQDDTNKNMTQRILLLLESVPIGPRSAYDRVARAVIDRYLEEEGHLLVEGANRFKVPRFLLNDIVRFWRTMAVDFASKQRDRGGDDGWGLRNAKLRLSRKLIFASGLLICFSCYIDEALQDKISTESHDINLKHLANHIWNYVNLTPLDILASLGTQVGVPDDVSRKLFSAYDEFMAIVSDKETRAALKRTTAQESRTDIAFKRIRQLSQQFENGLNELFFKNQLLRPLTERYGVF